LVVVLHTEDTPKKTNDLRKFGSLALVITHLLVVPKTQLSGNRKKSFKYCLISFVVCPKLCSGVGSPKIWWENILTLSEQQHLFGTPPLKAQND